MSWTPPAKPLTSIHVRLVLPSERTEGRTHLTAQGESTFARASLWSYSEEWAGSYEEDLGPVDVAHHLLLCAYQDRPAARWQLDRSLQGLTVWEQLTMPL